DVLVGVCLDSGGHADHDPSDHLELGRDLRDAVDLDVGVDDDPSDTGLERTYDLSAGLVVAVQSDPLGWHTRSSRDSQFAASADVEVQSFLAHPSRSRRTQECLAGVVDVPSDERVAKRPCPGAEVVFIDDVRRRAVLARDVAHRHATDGQDTVVLAYGRGPQVRYELVRVTGNVQPRRPT